MYEIPEGRSAELILDAFHSRDLMNVLRFRLQCREEKKVGMIALGFGLCYWIDADGQYMDGKTLDAEVELHKLLGSLSISACTPATTSDDRS